MTLAIETSLRSPERGWSALFILSVLYTFAMMDRIVLAMIIGPLQADFGLGDFEAGLLLGPAFALTYVTLSFPAGLLVDRIARRTVLFCGLLIWTFAVLSSAFATSFIVLFLLRALVGVGEATVTPSAHSLLCDLFPKNRRGVPFSIFQYSGVLGAAIAFAGGGAILDWYGEAGPFVAFGQPLRGWQMAFLIAGLPGLLLAFLPSLLPEPRQHRAAETTAQAGAIWPFVREHRRVLILIFAIFACSMTIGYAQSSWTAEYLRRTFNWSPTKIGSTIGLIHLIFPLLSHVISGFVVDALSSRGRLDAPLRVFLLMAILGFPFLLAQFLIPSPWIFLVSACAVNFLVTPTLAFGNIALQQFTPSQLRGRVSASFLAFFSLAGLTIGPGLVGAVSEFGFEDPGKLGYSIAILVGVMDIVVIALLLLVLQPLREAVARANAAGPAA